jgi:two-component system, NarL family, sensor histidine kinase UhpB
MVAKPYPVVSYPVTSSDHKPVQIRISVNPLDEISEAWQETQVFFAVILWLSSGLFLAVNLIFSQVLQTVEQILKNLSELETENYQNPLPHFAITEFERIALAINHLTATLHKAQQENNRLTLHSLEIQEEQRQTLAQELHDELGQSITAIKVMAVTGKKTPGQQVEIYQSIVSVCDHLVSVVRSMMKNLHPLILTELGLTASLHDLIAHWQARTPGLKISLLCDVAVDGVEIKKAIQVFRMVQEGMTNVVRHAQAQHVLISLVMQGKAEKILRVVIEDNGVGCDLKTLSLGFGLLGMQARVKSLKGNMQILTAKNQGLKIYISIPVS